VPVRTVDAESLS